MATIIIDIRTARLMAEYAMEANTVCAFAFASSTNEDTGKSKEVLAKFALTGCLTSEGEVLATLAKLGNARVAVKAPAAKAGTVTYVQLQPIYSASSLRALLIALGAEDTAKAPASPVPSVPDTSAPAGGSGKAPKGRKAGADPALSAPSGNGHATA